MATQRQLRDSEWDVADLHWPHAPSRAERTVQCVFRRDTNGGEWEAWCIVAPSAILQRVGKRGLGLYAAAGFQKNDFVGLYDGRVVGTFPSRRAALDSNRCARLVRAGYDKLITRRPIGGGRGVELVDGSAGGPPFLHYINDPRGSGLRPNTTLTPGGYIKVLQSRIAAFDLDADLEHQAGAELRFSYGDEEYWSFMERLGTTSDRALEVLD